MAEAEELKACTKCGEQKPLSEYHRFTDKRRGTSGYRWACKKCSKAAASQWVDENREQRRATQRAIYNRRKSDDEFMERKRAAARETQRRAWADEHTRERKKRDYQRARQRDVVRFLLRAAKSRAKKRGLPFDLTREWADARWNGRCELTGIEFQPQTGGVCPYSPSIDKIDPEQGYTQSNCRFILSALNFMKSNGTDADLFAIAEALIAKRNNKWRT